MRKVVLIAMLTILCLPVFVSASSLKVDKIVNPSQLDAGSDVKISLRVENPFDTLKVRIRDKNILGNNGLDIQCLERTLKKGVNVLEYEPITAFKEGEYTLEAAEVTYTNPRTQKGEKAYSEPVKVKVNPSNKTRNAQGITTIYECGGQSIRSTSFSYGSSINIQVGSGGQPQNQPQLQPQPSHQPGKNLPQMNQDTQTLKKELEERSKKEELMKKEFERNLMNNSDLQKVMKGFNSSNLTQKEIAPKTNTTGSFKFNYTNGGWIEGTMENNSITTLQYGLPQDQLWDKLQKNPKYKQYDKQLRSEGFKRDNPIFSRKGNTTQILVPYNYSNLSSKSNPIRNPRLYPSITAEALADKIVSVELNRPSQAWWPFIFLILLIAILLTFLSFYKRPKIKPVTKKAAEEPRDYRKEALSMVEEAQKLYKRGKKKEAYTKVSDSVRFLYIHTKKLEKGITNTSLLRHIREGEERKNASKVLQICSLVEFARYKPNDKDFKEAVRLAQLLIR